MWSVCSVLVVVGLLLTVPWLWAAPSWRHTSHTTKQWWQWNGHSKTLCALPTRTATSPTPLCFFSVTFLSSDRSFVILNSRLLVHGIQPRSTTRSVIQSLRNPCGSVHRSWCLRGGKNEENGKTLTFGARSVRGKSRCWEKDRYSPLGVGMNSRFVWLLWYTRGTTLCDYRREMISLSGTKECILLFTPTLLSNII